MFNSSKILTVICNIKTTLQRCRINLVNIIQLKVIMFALNYPSNVLICLVWFRRK